MSLATPVRQALAAGLLSMLCVSGPAAATTEPAPAGSPAPTAQAAEESGTSVSASPVVAAVVAKLQDSVFAENFAKDDVAAALAFYGARKDPLWTTCVGADDWRSGARSRDRPGGAVGAQSEGVSVAEHECCLQRGGCARCR